MSTVGRRNRAERLFADQKGVCWVCLQPMLSFIQRSNDPLIATLDHLTRKNVRPGMIYRPAKAAHAVCNHVRKHYSLHHPRVRNHIHFMVLWFSRNPPRRLAEL